MTRTRKTLLSLACGTLIWFAQTAVAFESPVEPFAGLWKVTVTPDSATAQQGRDTFKDQLLIEDTCVFTAEAFGPMGFAPSTMTFSSNNGTVTFSSSASNDTLGTIHWGGHVNGSTLTGTLTWTRSDGSVSQYSYSGTRTSD